MACHPTLNSCTSSRTPIGRSAVFPAQRDVATVDTPSYVTSVSRYNNLPSAIVILPPTFLLPLAAVVVVVVVVVAAAALLDTIALLHTDHLSVRFGAVFFF